MKLSAIILAGGQSTRMKYNKEHLKIGSSYLIHQRITTLKKYFDEIIVVSNNKIHYKDYPVKVVSDILDGSSPIIGLHAGLHHSSNDYNFVIACDMPFIDYSYIDYLISKITSHDAYIAQMNRFYEPFHGIYHKRIIPLIENLVAADNFGFQHMIRQTNYLVIHEEEIAPFLLQKDLFKNINSETELYDIEQNKTKEYRPLEIGKIQGDSYYQVIDKIITEYPLSIYVNNKYYVTMMTTPTNLEFLVIGYLYNESIIHSPNDIKELSINLEEHIAQVSTTPNVIFNNENKVRILSSACGGNKIPDDISLVDWVQNDNFAYDKEIILEQVLHFNKASSLFKETGGVHSVLLQTKDQELLMEDIGRHNAVDKIVGYIVKNNLLNSQTHIITSGRISSDILLKCARANIPLIVSRSAPTTLAVHLGEQLNVTIVGFARGKSMNIYTHPNRIQREGK